MSINSMYKLLIIAVIAQNFQYAIAEKETDEASKDKSKSTKAAKESKVTDSKSTSSAGSQKGGLLKKAVGLQVNDKVPDISLPDQTGKVVNFADYLGKKVMVVYFYPKDDTSVCTAEACTFRDSYDAFKELGAEVIGISSDSADSHKKFAEKHKLPFRLLADTSGMARKAFGVPNTMGILPGRVTYVVDRNGVIRYVFNSATDGPKHVTEAMKIVKELSEKS